MRIQKPKNELSIAETLSVGIRWRMCAYGACVTLVEYTLRYVEHGYNIKYRTMARKGTFLLHIHELFMVELL